MISAFGITGKTQGPSHNTEFGIRSVDDSFLRGPHITSFQIAKPGLNTWVSITSKTTESQSILENSHSQGLHELPVIPSLAADGSSHRITIVPKLQILTVEEFMLIQPSEVQERSASSFSGVRGRTLDKLKTKQQAVKNGVSYETCSTLSYKSWFRKHFTSHNSSHIQLVGEGGRKDRGLSKYTSAYCCLHSVLQCWLGESEICLGSEGWAKKQTGTKHTDFCEWILRAHLWHSREN